MGHYSAAFQQMIATFLKGIFSGIWGYVVAGLGVLFTLLGLLSKAKKAGRDEVIAKTKEKEVETVKKAAKVERKVDATPADERRARLRKRWSRD